LPTVPTPDEAEAAACPFCRSPLAPQALKCAQCGANVGDIKLCPACAEPIRAAARLCPFCRQEQPPAEGEGIEDWLREPWVIYASPLGALIAEQSLTGLFYPPSLKITPTEIHIQRRMFLGLRIVDQKISVARVASVRAVKGVIWGGIVIETYGGSQSDLAIGGLDKEDARQTARLIERVARLSRTPEER